MTIGRFRFIRERQMENNQKCRLADFVVQTGLGRPYSLRKVAQIIKLTKRWQPRNWHPSNSR